MHGLNGRLIFGQEVSSPCLLSITRSASLLAASLTDLLTQLLYFETADTLQHRASHIQERALASLSVSVCMCVCVCVCVCVCMFVCVRHCVSSEGF